MRPPKQLITEFTLKGGVIVDPFILVLNVISAIILIAYIVHSVHKKKNIEQAKERKEKEEHVITFAEKAEKN